MFPCSVGGNSGCVSGTQSGPLCHLCQTKAQVGEEDHFFHVHCVYQLLPTGLKQLREIIEITNAVRLENFFIIHHTVVFNHQHKDQR